MADSQEKSKIRVCVIGAGAAGLCSARHLSNDLLSFEPAIFERASDIGGTWVYTDKTGADDNGFPIHSSMYKNLRTNFPLKLMNFPDYQQMNQTRPSCGSHEQVLNYLNDYAEHFNIRRFIQFETSVECVRPIMNGEDWKMTTWKVKVKNLKSGISEEKDFDAIIVCNGHYAVPKTPLIPGIMSFSGHQMHSHDYRKPEIFSGKTVIVLGAGPSGIDIAIEISACANKVYLSHNGPRFTSPLPSNLFQVPGIESVDRTEFTLKDGTSVTAEELLYCTGYLLTYPFLDESCKVMVDENFVSPLYKHLINVEHPKMCIIGIMSRIIPFVMFQAQVQYFLGILRGKIQLPSKEAMLTDSEPKGPKKSAHVLGDRQWEYYNDLADLAGIDRAPEFYGNAYAEWNIQKNKNLLKYKNSEIIVEEDGKSVHFNLEG